MLLKPGASQNLNVSGNYVHGKAHSHKSDCFPVLALDCMVVMNIIGKLVRKLAVNLRIFKGCVKLQLGKTH